MAKASKGPREYRVRCTVDLSNVTLTVIAPDSYAAIIRAAALLTKSERSRLSCINILSSVPLEERAAQ